MTSSIKLTEYSHGAGCGCKLSPAVLEEILVVKHTQDHFSDLLVGNETKDDAAVLKIDEKTAIVSTTDFFMPIVDDPYTFGAIAATNAISDIYAMGATPIMAIAILGWPIAKLPTSVAAGVLAGGKEACSKAGIPLAGGHSIDTLEPIFGLAVTGKIDPAHLKRNSDAKSGDLIYLTKPLGIGLATTAQKKKLATDAAMTEAVASMLTLNNIGAILGKQSYVHAMTDVTGFGLAGHLLEVCQSSRLGARITYSKIPQFSFVPHYLDKKCFPGGTQRNWNSYGDLLNFNGQEEWKYLLCDPQTSGGLLITIDNVHQKELESLLNREGCPYWCIGKMSTKEPGKPLIYVEG